MDDVSDSSSLIQHEEEKENAPLLAGMFLMLRFCRVIIVFFEKKKSFHVSLCFGKLDSYQCYLQRTWSSNVYIT